MVIAATNHPGLLDPAVWRRFPYLIQTVPARPATSHGVVAAGPCRGRALRDARPARRDSDGLSPADIRELALGARRASIIGDAPVVIDDLVRCVLASRSGALAVPTGRALTGAERRRLAVALLPFSMTRAQMASLVGVSRQRVDEYVRELGERRTPKIGRSAMASCPILKSAPSARGPAPA